MYNAHHCSALCGELFRLTSRNLAGETAHLGLNWVKFSVDVHRLSKHSHMKISDVDRDDMLKHVMRFLIDLLERTGEIIHPRDEKTSWRKLGCKEQLVRTWLSELDFMVSPEMHLWFYRRFPTYFENPHDDGLVE